MKTLKNTLLLILLSLPFLANSQTDFRVSYHPYINDAELAIIDGNFKRAFQNYQRAFFAVETGFARDYQNATLCAIEVGEYEAAMKYLHNLVAKGIEKSFFLDNRKLYEKLNSHGFEEFLDSFNSIRHTTFEQTVNYEVIGRLGELENFDQAFRYDPEIYMDTIQKIDAENIRGFVALVEEYGFPSEEMLGIQQPHADRTLYNLIIWHHLKNWKSDTTLIDIRPIIVDAVKAGKLSPEVAAGYFDIAESRVGAVGSFGATGVLQIGGEDNLYLLNYEASERVKVDKNRQKLGLFNLSDYEKKIRFHFITENRTSKYEVLKLRGIDRYPAEAKEVFDLRVLE